MSIRVMTAVWDIALPDSEKIVLLALADCANDEGYCWPSMATLAKKCSKSDRTVQASIKSLVEAGHLTRSEVPGKGCSYTVHPRSSFTPEVASPPKGATQTPEAASDKPSRTIKPSEAKASSGKRAAQPRFALPSHIPADAWADFIDMRKRMGKPMTDRAKELAVAKLDKLAADGWPPGDVLNNSTLNSYQGLFPPKELPNGRHQSTVQQTGNGLHRPHSRAVSRYLSLVEQEEAERRDAADHSGTEFQVPPLIENRH